MDFKRKEDNNPGMLPVLYNRGKEVFFAYYKNPWVKAVTIIGIAFAISYSIAANGVHFSFSIGTKHYTQSPQGSLDLESDSSGVDGMTISRGKPLLTSNVNPKSNSDTIIFSDNHVLHSTEQVADVIVKSKKQQVLEYIELYKHVAIEEGKKYGIPPSIKMAQAILESGYGKSRLARIDNNHFGIKCKKKCVGCRCVNYEDDSKYDMFRIFETAWYSFREHSKLLNGPRYAHLKSECNKDYKCWAKGLKKAGYATSKRYAEKIISVVETYNLQELDQYI